MAKTIEVEIDEETGELTIEAKGFATRNGVCQGEAATKVLEGDLGGINERKYVADTPGGQHRQGNSARNTQSQR